MVTSAAELSRKRKADTNSDADSPPPTKKKPSISKTTAKANLQKSSISDVPPTYSPAELAGLSHTDLLAHAIALQQQSEATPNSSPKELSPEDLAKKVDHLRKLMERQIRKSMTWKPSCKTGTATFSQDFIVQSEQVVKALFRCVVKEGGKAWKMKKLSVDDFEDVVGDSIEASIRYDTLVLTSDVTVRWDAENGTMKCSGKYGKYGTGNTLLAVADDGQ